MGAAASVKLIYKDAVDWFRQYFDDEAFVADFHAIDKDHDGGIRYSEFSNWLSEKAANSENGTMWRFFVSHPEIVAIAHMQAGSHEMKLSRRAKKSERIVDISDFRALLIQLFTVSIFWTHFKKADEWQCQQRAEAHDGKLTVPEFIMAVKSFCAAYGQEMLSEEQLTADFQAVDLDGSGQISLLEICGICTKFIDPLMAEQVITGKELDSAVLSASISYKGQPKELKDVAEGISYLAGADNHEDEGAHTRVRSLSSEPDVERHRNTSVAMMGEITKNASVAEFMEMKMATEAILEEFSESVI